MLSLILNTIFISSANISRDVKMNDISFLSNGDFTNNWKLVTVRYRQDSQEMRFIYANPIAENALKKGVLPFPDGSIFAKAGVKTGVDPAFNSSVVPSGVRRFQYMVKNKEKYSQTDGWGYALFQSDGSLFESDVKGTTMSCHACHKLVPNRDYIFSDFLELSLLVFQPQNSKDKIGHRQTKFVKLLKSEFKNNLKKYLSNSKFELLEILDGEMRDNFFGGTLDEVTPLLIKNTLEVKSPSAFLSRDQKSFKVISLSSRSSCQDSKISFDVVEFRGDWSKKRGPHRSKICYNKNSL